MHANQIFHQLFLQNSRFVNFLMSKEPPVGGSLWIKSVVEQCAYFADLR